MEKYLYRQNNVLFLCFLCEYLLALSLVLSDEQKWCLESIASILGVLRSDSKQEQLHRGGFALLKQWRAF